MRKWMAFVTLFGCIAGKGFSQSVKMVDTASVICGEGVILKKTSFRGLCVVNDTFIWISGNHGSVGMSGDGGNTFHIRQLKGYERSDFRDIEAFDKNHAVIMSSGTPAVILET